MNRLLTIDGHNYLYRSYFGIPSTAKLKNGLQVNAFYGFFSLLRKAYQYVKPSEIIVVFDSENGVQGKLLKSENYKQNRDYSNTGMFKQLPIIKEALEYIGIPYIENPDYEGDDVIGSIAKKESKVSDVYISSQDNDFLQLIDENIFVLSDKKGKVITYTKEYFEKIWGIESYLYLNYLSLKGDPSDNILGVKGIGKKTALKLVEQYKLLENILQKSDNKYLKGNEELVKKNKEFLRINCDLNLKYELKEFDNDKILQNSSEILRILKYTN
ncbi:MAG: polymerase I protein [candidate division WS6 bacterium GW2011_GWC1_36_11]|uniref:Polymerase I protein n=1 Tax=candidate division WS6 bacterium GW2011_GWC1_36_11 TaxID=1619090 RepID=A0A0G0GJD8_9BACT|nr:MAG: polymerase I protein [candidate division WS6 bacterium GW2011_GWC1_36_11]HAM37155.1 hypothetical protein [Patescibacteria group bacterium]HAM96266.1 hypothetical protein [Patescibacteria group bacterium]